MEKVELGDIHFKGYLKRSYEPDTMILRRLEEVKFNPVKDDISVGVWDLHYYVKDFYLSLWKSAGLNIHNCTFRTRKIEKDNQLKLHSIIADAQYKAIIPCNEEPALFYYGNKKKLEKQSLKFGDIIFLKTGDSNFRIKSEKTKVDIPIIEIYGALSSEVFDEYF